MTASGAPKPKVKAKTNNQNEAVVMDHRSFPGCTQWEFAERLLAEANATRCMVLGDWNGTPMLAVPRGDIIEMVANWDIVRTEQQASRTN